MKNVYCSLNEIEALAKKSARSIGMSWGLAEETSKATRYLAAHRLGEHVSILLGLLEKTKGYSYSELCPKNIFEGSVIASLWEAPQGQYLCPIVCSALFNDCAKYLPEEITLKNIYYPSFLLPTLAWNARLFNVGFQLVIGELTFWILPNKVYYKNLSSKRLLTACEPKVFITKILVSEIKISSQSNMILLDEVKTMVELTAENFDKLDAFASRTYVPATVESRLKGAGSSLSDND
jgi:hypothetical protein